MRNQKFYVCKVCDSVVGKLDDGDKAFTCCDNKMEEMVPQLNDNRYIKYSFNDNELEVNASDKFSFVYVETSQGGQRKNVEKSNSNKVSFSFVDDKPFAIFAYSKVHGLIKVEF